MTINKYDFLNECVYDERDHRIPYHVRVRFNIEKSAQDALDGAICGICWHDVTGWCVVGWVDHVGGDNPHVLWSEKEV